MCEPCITLTEEMKVTAFADFLPFYRQISQRKRGIFCNQKYQGKFFSITRRIFHLPKASANVRSIEVYDFPIRGEESSLQSEEKYSI
jgi:hypothetical protein